MESEKEGERHIAPRRAAPRRADQGGGEGTQANC